ncbi:MAG: hypothetical protein AB7V77_05355 [Candidatus Woesearchaeota archaeon]
MFVRAKTIKDKKYAYLVENIWKKKKVCQKVKKYLGKIVILEDVYLNEAKSFEEYDWNLPTKLIIRDIISDEFERRGFLRKNLKLIKDNLIINLSTCKIQEKNADVVLFLNGIYLYGKLLNQLENFNESELEDETKGLRLAKIFSDCGISINQQVFIHLYKKIYQLI